MSRVAVLALAAACSAPGAPRTAAVVAPPPAAAPATPLVAPIVRTDPGEGGIEAPQGGAIRMLAAVPDGGAALTADDLHGVRLWPTLDGNQEPRSVELPQARQLALGRHGAGFTAAVLDPAGGLYIATLDAQGRSHSHVSLAADPAEYLGIAAATRGLVAWRADQSVMLLDGDGAALGRLATEPGERIVSVAVSGEHAAVLLDRDGKRGVRTIALDKPAWGAWIDVAAADLVALAPSGQLAVRDGSAANVYDTSGKLLQRLIGAAGESLVFVDDTHLAMSANNRLVWLGDKPQAAGAINATIVAAGGRVITASNGDVMLATPSETRYLGYDVATPMVAQAIGGGQLALGYLTKLYTVDTRLRVVRALNMSVRDRAVELRWLGDDAWAVESGVDLGDDADFRLVTAGNTRVIKNHLEAPSILGYEPTTHLDAVTRRPAHRVSLRRREARSRARRREPRDHLVLPARADPAGARARPRCRAAAGDDGQRDDDRVAARRDEARQAVGEGQAHRVARGRRCRGQRLRVGLDGRGDGARGLSRRQAHGLAARRWAGERVAGSGRRPRRGDRDTRGVAGDQRRQARVDDADRARDHRAVAE